MSKNRSSKNDQPNDQPLINHVGKIDPYYSLLNDQYENEILTPKMNKFYMANKGELKGNCLTFDMLPPNLQTVVDIQGTVRGHIHVKFKSHDGTDFSGNSYPLKQYIFHQCCHNVTLSLNKTPYSKGLLMTTNDLSQTLGDTIVMMKKAGGHENGFEYANSFFDDVGNVKIDFIEPVIITSDLSKKLLHGLQSIKYQYLLQENVIHAFPWMDANKFSASIVDSEVYLDWTYMMPSRSLENKLLSKPSVVKFPYTRYFTQGVIKVDGVLPKVIESNEWILGVIPDNVMITVRDKHSKVPIGIRKVHVSLNEAFNTVTHMEQYQLFSASRRNGSKQDYSDFLQRSYVLLDFHHDINIEGLFDDQTLTKGSAGNFVFKCKVTLSDPLPQQGEYELSMVFTNNGFIVSQLGSAVFYCGIVTKQDVLEATATPK